MNRKILKKFSRVPIDHRIRCSCLFFHFWDIKLWYYKKKHRKTWGRERGSICIVNLCMYIVHTCTKVYVMIDHNTGVELESLGTFSYNFFFYVFINSWVDMSNAIHDEMDNQHAHASWPSELGGRQGSSDCWFLKIDWT